MSVVLALAAALTYGLSDFIGGLASRRERAVLVLLMGYPAGALLLLGLLPLMPGTLHSADLGWSAAAGLAGAAGIVLFYLGLATGPMAVVAPLAAVSSAALPVAAGLALGERPPPVAYPGVALALLAVVLVSRGGRPDPAAGGRGRRAALLGLAAGAGFGGYFVLLARCGPAGGVWPLLVSRGSASVLVVVLAVATGAVARPVAGVVRLALLAGSLDTTANLLYLLAVQRGLLALVAVLVALYPATTVTLATLVLGERTGRTQRIGLAVAAASVALIAAA